LQVSSFRAKQWSQYYFFQDDWRPTPSLTVNLGLRYENSTVPLGFFGATDQQSLSALVPGPVERDNNNWAPRVGFAWSPAPQGGVSRWLLGDTTSSIRGGYGKSYDVLFYNILVVNASNYPRVVTGLTNNAIDVYPNLAPVSGAPVFNPLATFVNSPQDMEYPESHNWSLSWQRAGPEVCGRARVHGEPGEERDRAGAGQSGGARGGSDRDGPADVEHHVDSQRPGPPALPAVRLARDDSGDLRE
jgi:hypothetical protein